MIPLWKLRSGQFAGWNSDGVLYGADGRNVGYFEGSLAVGLNGRVVGEMYDDRFIGYRLGIAYPLYAPRAQYAGLAFAPYAAYAGYAIGGWEDPHF